MRNISFWLLFNARDFGSYLAYRWKLNFNYYLFVEGINVIIFIFTLILMLIFSIFYEQTNFLDPIVHVKKKYLIAEFISAIVGAVALAVISIKASEPKSLSKDLLILSIIMVIAIMGFGFGKIYMDSIYTEEKFSQLYEEKVDVKKAESYKKLDISLKGFKIIDSNQKKEYIAENMHNYKVFTRKNNIILILFFLVWILNLYLLIKVISKIQKIKKLEKDDIVVYDEEINVKM